MLNDDCLSLLTPKQAGAMWKKKTHFKQNLMFCSWGTLGMRAVSSSPLAGLLGGYSPPSWHYTSLIQTWVVSNSAV